MTAAREAQWERLRDNLRNYRVGTCVGGVQKRLEINDLAVEKVQFNLFLLALESLQKEVSIDEEHPLRKKNLKKDFLSYFHIAGIHGIPAIDWGDVPQNWYFKYLRQNGSLDPDWWKPPDPGYARSPNTPKWKVGSPAGGYCVHGSPLFLIWHRPYLALLEQMIAVTAKDLADSCEDILTRKEWQKAAAQLRFPYWDFCRPNKGSDRGYDDSANLWYGLPDPMRVKFVRVLRPNARSYENIVNPLYQYTYPDDAKLRAAFPNLAYSRTERNADPPGEVGEELIAQIRRICPNQATPAYTARWPNAQALSQNDVLENKASQTVDIQRLRVYYTLTNQKNFIQLSCARPMDMPGFATLFGSSKGYAISLENIHDDYHPMIGGTNGTLDITKAHTGVDMASATTIMRGGTLTPPQTAGFEPGFWMMHGFYEYTMCLWQTIHHNKWWESDKYKRVMDNCVWLRENSLEGPDTPLLPFKLPKEKVNPADPHEFWTATNARDWIQFGYTYEGCPSVIPDNDTDRNTSVARATKRVNNLYGWMYLTSPHDNPSRDKFLEKGGLAMFDLKQGGAPPTWTPSTTVAATAVLDELQPIRVFNDLSWYPKLKVAAQQISDTTVMDDLDVDVSRPFQPRVAAVRRAVLKAPTTSSPVAPEAPLSTLALKENLESAQNIHAQPEWSAERLGNARPIAVDASVKTEVPKKTEVETKSLEELENVTVPEKASNDAKPVEISAATEGAAKPTRRVVPAIPCVDKSGAIRHYNLHYEVDRWALNGTFFVHVFIGDFSPDHHSWSSEPNHVHASCIWVRTLTEADGRITGCANCRRLAEDNSKYGDWVPLTLKLSEFIASGQEHPAGSGLVLRSMDQSEVIPFLTRNLHWRIVDINGVQVSREDTSGLKVWVASKTLKMPEKITELPVWGDLEEHIDITHGRPTGVCHPE